MGKEYFEFLEEEYMGLTSQVQRALKQEQQQKQQKQDNIQNQNDPTDKVDLPLLFTRCNAIYQQMRIESRKTPEFKERLTLYSIQLTALLEHYQNSFFPPSTDSAPATSVPNTNRNTAAPASTPPTVQPTNAAVPTESTMRQELTFMFTIGDDDDYDTSLL
jgi:hypothetical protein